MGTVLASAVIALARIQLNDSGGVRWGDSELLGWINAGQREIARLKPDASRAVSAVQLAAGTKQAIPAGGVSFVGMNRNMGSGGSTPGRAVVPMTMAMMNTMVPEWHKSDPNTEVQFCVHETATPKVFFVWPPQPATGMHYAEIVYFGTPAEVGATSSAITLDDIYVDALVDYMLCRAKGKSTEAGDRNESAAIYQRFLGALGMQEAKQ